MSSSSSHTSAPSTPFKRYPESTVFIPTPEVEKTRPKQYDPAYFSLPVIIGTPLLMLMFGIALEFGCVLLPWLVPVSGLNVSCAVYKYQSNAEDFLCQRGIILKLYPHNFCWCVPWYSPAALDLSASSFQSFFPTLFVIPVGYLWRTLDWMLRWYQPYVAMSRGSATAEESVLLDYIPLGATRSIFHSLKHNHKVIFWSSVLATSTYLFQPLAGSIFQLQTRGQVEDTTVQSTLTLGLIPDIDELNAFAAAAGFVQAAVFNHLPDPPFISADERGGWATAEFVFPTNIGLNGSMTVNTTAILTNSNCSNPSTAPTVDPVAGVISSTSVHGCTTNITFDPQVSDQQFGITSAPCGDSTSLNITLQPVVFWFWQVKEDETPEGRMVFCNPTMEQFNVNATADLNTGQLTAVTILNNNTAPNNLTDSPLNGLSYNAILFPPNPNPFIQARSEGTKVGVPGAIFRSALQQANGLQSVFDLPNGFLDLTNTVYTQHLAITAKSIYFVARTARFLRCKPRWFPVCGSILLGVSGFFGLFLQLIHRHQRRNVVLGAPPGTIAAAVALTARSGFGHLLAPYDNLATIKKKLGGLRFRMDKRTGMILTDGYDTIGHSASFREQDERLSLLGHECHREQMPSSSQFGHGAALEAARPHPAWKEHQKTSYDR
ncbi:hypothetical protein B0H17DRAFT_1206412 [Mycena rosella]|uniref:Transmembrane protein n=1 Tax=Mycena rosella TaxID=1033263 RepID=A0AAD7G9C3_MYCRO|nr:hypothetical protein B0H17DRAFT_1206412 [Mycena rosella]